MSFDRDVQRQPGAAPAASVTDGPSPGKRTLVQDLPASAPVQRSAARRAEARVPAPGIGDAGPRSSPDMIQQLFGPPSQVQRAPSTGLAQARSSFAAAFEPGGDAAQAGAITEQARAGVAGGGQQVPHLAAIQRSFGSHDVSGVRAHVGGKTADAADAMGAEAYAFGNDVAFRQSPDLHTAAHEAAHVVQQQAGIQLKGGLGQSGDSHERHADAVADRVVRGESAQSLLDQYGGATGGGAAGVQYLFQTMTTALETGSHDRGQSARSNPEYVAIVALLNQGIQLQQAPTPTVQVVGQMLGLITQIQAKITAARSTKWFTTGQDRNNALQALTGDLITEQGQLQQQQTVLKTTAAATLNAAGPHPGLGQGPHQITNTGAQQGASGSYFDHAPGTNALNGVFKPESQEGGARAGRGKRGDGAVREVMGDALDQHLGLGVVPPTRLSAIDSPAHTAGATDIPGSGDSLQVGSYQQAVANPTGDLTSYMRQQNATQAFDPDSLQKIAILDMISLNKDRHGANVMHDAAGGLHAIDQGEMAPTAMAFNGKFRDNNNASGWAWADLPESEQDWSAANRQTIANMDPDATVDHLAHQARTTSAQMSSVTGQPATDTHLSESQIAMMKYGARTLKLCAEAGLTPAQTESIYTKRANDRDARQIGATVQRTAKTAGGGEFADFINKTFFQDDLAAQTAQMTHAAVPAPVFTYQSAACEEEWSIAMAKGLNRVAAAATPPQLAAIHHALEGLLLPVQAGAAQQPVTPNDAAATASRLWAHIETGKTAVGTAGLDEKVVLDQIWASGTPQLRQRIIQVLDVQGDQLRMSHLGYILEAVDPQHRMNLPSQLVTWYQDQTARGGDFINWVAAQPAAAAGDTTDYRDARRRAEVEVHVNAGRLQQAPAAGVAQAPMTTSGGDGWAVVLSAGQFYSQPKSPASDQVKTQHSSFMAGLPVDAAAMMRVNSGTLEFLRNHSGHYTPTAANMVRMILTFLSHGVAMADVTVRDDRLEILRQNRTATPKTEFGAMEYLGIARDQTR